MVSRWQEGCQNISLLTYNQTQLRCTTIYKLRYKWIWRNCLLITCIICTRTALICTQCVLQSCCCPLHFLSWKWASPIQTNEWIFAACTRGPAINPTYINSCFQEISSTSRLFCVSKLVQSIIAFDLVNSRITSRSLTSVCQEGYSEPPVVWLEYHCS